ncbi:hypothetical protein [Streptococcus parasanguinis]|uniref:hypothetical protein n=1 Tax=Streptococcus parasanguinis TaxID=1318 RepID=UPI0039C082C5
MGISDLACFLLLPIGEENIAGVPNVHPKLVTPPLGYNVNRKTQRSLAQTVESQSRPIQISAQAGKRHTVFLGSTGCGKTTTMRINKAYLLIRGKLYANQAFPFIQRLSSMAFRKYFFS